MSKLNDTTAAIATGISTSSAVITFTQTWQPVLQFGLGVVGLFSGVMAIIYYYKKINNLNNERSKKSDGGN